MAELADNSGEYDPNRRLEDFSKGFLIELMREYARAYLAMDGFWNAEVARRIGYDAAMDCEEAVWKRIANYMLPRLARLTNISLPAADVLEAMKVLQLSPDDVNPDIYKTERSIEDRNHVVVTIARCNTLEWFEENAPDRIATLCQRVEVAAIKEYYRVMNPNVKCDVLKIPPREGPDEIACQWGFRLESGD
ncbi:DUF6125 family protein [Chloroflexota bacterium]